VAVYRRHPRIVTRRPTPLLTVFVLAAGLAACGVGSADPSPSMIGAPAGTLGFEVLASGTDLSDGPDSVEVVDADVVPSSWRDLTDASAPPVPDGSVGVVEDDGTWTVLLEGNDLANCATADVVLSEVHLVAVDAAEPPRSVAHEIEELPGCDL
jgi:hypothetical protein